MPNAVATLEDLELETGDVVADLSVRLTRDVREASTNLSIADARYLVDMYYKIQKLRVGIHNAESAMVKAGEPTTLLGWLADQLGLLERQIQRILDIWTKHEPSGMGEWARNVTGIGPVLAAGLLAEIDIHRAPTVGHIWAFAGLDPERRWRRGQKRPWNGRLKTLCWKIGESFVKVSGRENDIYGHIYRERRAYEEARNERGEYAAQAAAKLAEFNIGADTKARGFYEAGKLPPGHIHERCKRYAVKQFLADFWSEWYRREIGVPPLPYPLAHLGHVHQR